MPPARFMEFRRSLAESTIKLLGDTITFSESDWAGSSLLEGWSRGHVGTHLARNADALGRLIQGVLDGRDAEMYDSPARREAEINQGARRSGLELQLDLDESCNTLESLWDRLDPQQLEATVTLHYGTRLPLRLLPLARLTEVVLHHVDLDCRFNADSIDDESAGRMMEFCLRRLSQRRDFPVMTLVATNGSTWRLGSVGPSTEVKGTPGNLLCWLARRAATVTGAETIKLPSFG